LLTSHESTDDVIRGLEAGVGTALSDSDCTSGEDPLRMADEVMYRAKRLEPALY
jgi:hypothetical protein